MCLPSGKQAARTLNQQRKKKSEPNAAYYEYDVNAALFYVALHGAGIPATLHIGPGGHDWGSWTAELPHVLRFVTRAFKGEADTRDPAIDSAAADGCPP